jgi:hypothetical protein
MKLLLPLAALTVTSHAIPGLSCLDLARAVINVDVNKLAADTWSKICDQGLDLRLSDGRRVIHQYGAPMFQQLAQELGMGADQGNVENVAGQYTALADEMLAMANERCASDLPENGSMCEDRERTTSFARCVQRGTWALALRKAPLILTLLEPGLCTRQAEVLDSGRVFGELFPEAVASYARDNLEGGQ